MTRPKNEPNPIVGAVVFYICMFLIAVAWVVGIVADGMR